MYELRKLQSLCETEIKSESCEYLGKTRMEIKLAIVGSRNFTDNSVFNTLVDTWIKEHGTPSLIISGGALGVDNLAKQYAIAHNIPKLIIHPQWIKYGKAAGPMRNTEIVNAATHILAFPSHQGKGTQDTISKAQGKHVVIHWVD